MKIKNKIKALISNRKKCTVVIATLFIVVLVVMLMLLYVKPMDITKPPIIVTGEKLAVISAEPTGKTESLNRLYNLSVRFNQNLNGNVNNIIVTVNPGTVIRKYTVASQPDTLWIAPESAGKEPGWKDEVQYTVTIKKGSKVNEDYVLENDYTFSFMNSTKDIVECADWCQQTSD